MDTFSDCSIKLPPPLYISWTVDLFTQAATYAYAVEISLLDSLWNKEAFWYPKHSPGAYPDFPYSVSEHHLESSDHWSWNSLFLLSVDSNLHKYYTIRLCTDTMYLWQIPGAGFWHAVLWWNILDFIVRSEEHTSELQSHVRISYAVFCLKKKKIKKTQN